MTNQERREYNRAWHKRQTQKPDWVAKQKRFADDANLKHNHGIDMDDFKAMLAAQGGVCAICGRLPSCQTRRFAVDHNHKTGKLRGILCSWCNRIVVPLFETYSQIVKPARAYLRKYV